MTRSRHPTACAPIASQSRLGPRPLPLYLATLMLNLASSSTACALSNSGLMPWSGLLADRADALTQALADGSPETAFAALDVVARARLKQFIEGVLRYRRLPEIAPLLPGQPMLWQEGSSRLLDYGVNIGRPKATLFLVPSLINRAHIFDLLPEQSFARYCAAQDLRTMLLDWGEPTGAENNFTLTDYIVGRLDAAIEIAISATPGPLFLLGYCMGGMMALAGALRRPQAIAGLVLLATPWDFAKQGFGASLKAIEPQLRAAIELWGMLPVDAIQTLLYVLDPFSVIDKFIDLGCDKRDNAALSGFAATEDWLNDGVKLAKPVALECLFDWYGKNTPAAGAWRIAGRVIDPGNLKCRNLAIVPDRDRLVPPASALALAKRLPNNTLLQPAFGHIGMLQSAAARTTLWPAIVEWIYSPSP